MLIACVFAEPDVTLFGLVIVGLLVTAVLVMILIAAFLVWWRKADEAYDQLNDLGPVPDDDPDTTRRED
ncbi:hypothetical protein R75461_08068 [Paraburkholderia nemoris]|nr:hypothetical protein R75461_08068 [Paraburkholderia nemoris]